MYLKQENSLHPAVPSSDSLDYNLHNLSTLYQQLS